MSLSFVNNLSFIALGSLVKEIVKTLERVTQEIIEWDKQNEVTYDISKTEAVLFSKFHQQQFNKQLPEAEIKVSTEKISFNKGVTRWLDVWLESQIKIISHINERVRKAQIAKI